MATYMMISSRDPFDHRDVEAYYNLAEELAGAGNQVTLFLVENGVFPARPCVLSQRLSSLRNQGVEVLADSFSLRERGIETLCEGVAAAPIDRVIDAMENGAKTLWN